MKAGRWAKVPGFPNYEVSTYGNVWRAGKVLSPNVRKFGYKFTELSRDGRRFGFMVHALVLMTFIGPRPDGMVACHNDGKTHNNHLENLRWDTHTNNMRDKYKHNTMPRGAAIHCVKLTEGCVSRVKDMLACGETQKAIADWFNVSQAAISAIARGRSWKYV